MQDKQFSIPIHLKDDPNMPWPEDKLFYLLSRNGLFLCRNHRWFESCTQAKNGPGELAEQKEFVRVNYPLIPRALIERAVGFFHLIEKAHHWESAVILAWNQNTQSMELVVPEQKANSAAVKYEIPALPPHLLLIGDIHSHRDFSPHSSMTDEDDELRRPGLHIVAGYIDKEPPQFYAVVVVDGVRFEIKDPKSLFEDYYKRDSESVPQEWLDKVKEKKWAYAGSGYYGNYSGSYYGDYPHESDKKVAKKVLAEFLEQADKPSLAEVSAELFRRTRKLKYVECDKKAERFLENWDKAKAAHEARAKCTCSRLFGQHAINCPARITEETYEPTQ